MNPFTARTPSSVSRKILEIAEMRSSTRFDAFRMALLTLVSTYSASGTTTTNSSVSCQLMAHAAVKHAAALSGSAITRPYTTFSPAATCSVSVANRDIRSVVPAAWSCRTSWRTTRRKNALRMSNTVRLVTRPTSDSWRNSNTPFTITHPNTAAMMHRNVSNRSVGRCRITFARSHW